MSCDCGAEKHGWTHAAWCSAANRNVERLVCEGFDSPCEVVGPTVTPQDSRTQYVWDGQGEDPNRDRNLCPDCAKHHHKHWDEMWGEYYSGRL